MKQSVIVVAILLIGMLAGCTSPKVAYRSKATLTPEPGAGHYDVVFTIEDVSDPGNPSMVSSPRLRVLKGKEGRISVGDATSGITCTALVDDAFGKPEAQTIVSIKKDGRVVWSKEQTVAMSK